MANRIPLNRLAETLIKESKTPFNTKDFAKHLERRWQKEVSGSAMKRLEKVLHNHSSLIGIPESDFIPFRAVVDKIRHVSLSVKLGVWELKQGVLIPGHRLIPFVPVNMEESELTFLDSEGKEISKLKKSYCIQDIVPFYQYSAHFPEEIKFNEWIPGKSRMTVTAWDMRPLYSKFSLRPGDALLINLVDYEKGIYQVRPYSSRQYGLDRLRMRALYEALAAQMNPLFQDEKFCSARLEKQLLRILFSINSDVFKYKTNKKFQIVVFNGVAHHTQNPKKILNNACKFLDKKGFIIYGIGNKSGFFQRALQRLILYKISPNIKLNVVKSFGVLRKSFC